MPFQIPNNAEVTYTSQAEPDRVDFDALGYGIERTGVLSGGGYTITGSDLNFDVVAGVAVHDGTTFAVNAGRVVATPSGSSPRFAIVTANKTNGTPTITHGTAQSNPAFPSLPSGHVLLYSIYLPTSLTAILATHVQDKRVEVPRGTNARLVISAGVASADPGLARLADYVCDGTADEVQINAALASLTQTGHPYSLTGAGGGKVVCLGQFSILAPIANTSDNVEFCGVFGMTTITVASGFVGSYAVDFNRDANSRNLLNIHIHDIRLNGATLNNASAGTIAGLRLTAGNSKIERVDATRFTSHGMIHRNFTGDTADQTDWNFCHSYNNAGDGWRSEGAYDNRMTSCETNDNTGCGFRFEGGAWQVVNSMAWVNHDYGFHVSGGLTQMFFSNCKSEQNNGGVFVGLRSSASPTNFTWLGGDIVSNSWDTTNTYDDVYVDAGTNVYFIDANIPARTYYPGQTTLARYGFNMQGGSNVRAFNCSFSTAANYGTSNVNILGGQEGNIWFKDCRNYNPIGAASITATGSPMTITAQYTEETIFLYGGTVSGITKNGVTIATGTHANVPVAVRLLPGEAIVVTYSSAPTMVRDRK